MTVARGDIVNLDERGIYHCCGRCVRRAFLCGDDPYTGRNFEHRRGWVRDRLELLAEAFGIDVFTYAVMSNHVHLVVRNRPDLAAAWSAQEVLDRWAMVYPTGGGCAATATPSMPVAGVVVDSGRAEADSARRDDCAVADDAAGGVAVDHARVEVLRQRLCDISWFMKALHEFIARRANREDHCRGRFWEGRFKCQRLLDEAAVLTCMTYVDLNPVRACMVKSLRDPQFTGAYDRIIAEQAKERLAGLGQSVAEEASAYASLTRAQQSLQDRETVASSAADWLTSFGCDNPPVAGLTQQSYLELLDWTGRQIRADKPGYIPDSLAPLLEQFSIDTERWLGTVDHYGSLFYRLVGRVEQMVEHARKLGRRWYRGLTAASKAFSTAPQPT